MAGAGGEGAVAGLPRAVCVQRMAGGARDLSLGVLEGGASLATAAGSTLG